MSASFTNQTLAQIELFANNKDGKYKKEVYVLPKSLDEKVARLHLAKIGVKLTELRKDQADYIGVPQQGPFKSGSLSVLIFSRHSGRPGGPDRNPYSPALGHGFRVRGLRPRPGMTATIDPPPLSPARAAAR